MSIPDDVVAWINRHFREIDRTTAIGLLEDAVDERDAPVEPRLLRCAVIGSPQTVKTGLAAFIERTVDLRLGAVTLEQLTKFMRAVETGRSMVVVSQLNVRTRDDKHEQLDVTMSVSTYERRVDSGKSTGKSNSKEDKS